MLQPCLAVFGFWLSVVAGRDGSLLQADGCEGSRDWASHSHTLL
jgi:hypothetical protein